MTAIDTLTILLAQEDSPSGYLLWGMVLGGVALGIVALELVVPSGGLLAMLAAASVVASIVSFFMYGTMAGVVSLLTYAILAPIVIVFGFTLWLNSPLAKFFILRSSISSASVAPRDGDEAIEEPAPPPGDRDAELRQLIGAFGETITPCRPVGRVRIEGHRVEALAETGTIGAGVPVVVTDVYDNQVKISPR